MLVLSRKHKQTVRIGDNITIHVHAIIGTRVVLGVVAPRDVAVHRGEVFEAIQRNKDITEGSTDGRSAQ